ncbi:MAG TPA: 1-acyl-sn-glycerol-3-phosphate acyltransferase [Anaerolineales bacterium]|nr:1-acyl-sn-glycerol-3-phosphate acyltransferase [Anaerolineales bacterium]
MSAAANTPDGSLRDYLHQVALQGILFVLNMPETRFTRWLVTRLFGRMFLNVIDVAVEFDHRVGEEGVQKGCQFISLRCGTPAKVHGAEQLPAEGPLLLVSNHPGYFDTMVILGHLPRRDVRVVVGGVPYFNEMPHVRQYIFYTDHSPQQQVQVLRDSVRYLNGGGCVLIYPTGMADPDPDVMDGAHAQIERWSKSVALMMRRAPAAKLVPVTVSGILAQKYLNHPVARIQPKVRYRQRVAEFFQLYQQFRRTDVPPLARPRVSFGKPVSLAELSEHSVGKELLPSVIGCAQAGLDAHMNLRGSDLLH